MYMFHVLIVIVECV